VFDVVRALSSPSEPRDLTQSRTFVRCTRCDHILLQRSFVGSG
jgi:hypothetical protein